MAGTVARPNVHNLGDRDVLREDHHRGDYRQEVGLISDLKSSQNMEENEILHQLEDNDSFHRTEVLNSLRSSIHSNDGQLPFQDCSMFFKRLQSILVDTDWDVRHQSIQLISDVIPHLSTDLDKCMTFVMPQLINNLGDNRVAIRKSVIQTLHVYMKYTLNVRQIFDALVIYGLESDDAKVRTETTVMLPMLLTPEFSKEDLSGVSLSLARKLSENKDDPEIAQLTLERVRNLVGDDEFCSYVDNFTPPVRQAYYRKASRASISSARSDISEIDISTPASTDSSKRIRVLVRQSNKFTQDKGILTEQLTRQLSDEDWKVRFKGVGELQSVLQSSLDTSRINQEFQAIVGFLCNLLDDTNFKVVQGSLDIFQVLVGRLKAEIKPFLKLVISALSKRFGDTMIVIRQAVMKVMMQLMQILSPQPVLVVLFESLHNKKSSVREGVLNITIATLLKFPSNDFDLGDLAREIAPTLSDPKRRVRQASLEAFAVLASAMGPNRIAPLISAVDQVELQMEEDGVMRAVQARLARRQLPKVRDDGLVEHATVMPSSATTRASATCSYDVLWIMKAAGGTTQSARERTLDHSLELAELSDAAPQKRFYSAGRGRVKLPWGEGNEDRTQENGSQSDRPHVNSAPIHQHDDDRWSYRSRHTWTSTDVDGHGLMELATPARRRQVTKDKNANFQDRSPEIGVGSGSYRQIHLNMLKRASITTNTNANYLDKTAGYGSQSAPPSERGSDTMDISSSKRSTQKQMSEDRNHKYVPSFAKTEREQELRKSKNVPGLSSSWPDSAFSEESPVRNKKTTDHLTEPPSTYHPGDFYRHESPKKSKPTVSPIPLKPTLARSAGKRNGRQTLSPLEKSPREDVDDWDQSYGTMRSDDDDFDSMESSLARLRNSAAARKKKQQTEKNDYVDRNGYHSDKSSSPSSGLEESGIFSMGSTFNTDPIVEKKTSPKKKGKKNSTADSPFSGKPVMARGLSAKAGRRMSSENLVEPNPFEYNPTCGVTFRDKPTSDVSVVGHAYGRNDNGYPQSTSPPIPTHAKKMNARERRRQAQTTPLSMASSNHTGSVEPTDDGQLSNRIDIGGVIGRGVFGQGSAINLDGSNSGHDKPTRKSSHVSTLPKGSASNVVGVAYSPSLDYSDEEELPVPHRTISKLTIEKVRQKQEELEMKRAQKDREKERLERLQREREYEERQQQLEENRREQLEKQRQREARQKEREEKLRLDREQKQREREARKLAMEEVRDARRKALEEENRRKKEARQKADEEKKSRMEKQRENLKQIDAFVIDATPITSRLSPKSSPDSSSPTEPSPQPPFTVVHKPPVHKKKSKNTVEMKSPPGTMRDESHEDSSEMKPFSNPDNALRDALSYLSNEDWEMKVDGLNYVRRLSLYHSDVLATQLHTVNIAVLAEVKNLRSQVSLLAIKTFGDLFLNMKAGMDKDLDKICKILLPKNAEANGFIRDATDKTMLNMVDNVTLQKALTSVLQGGSSSRSTSVKKTTARFVEMIVEKMGPGRVLSGIKDVTDAVLVAAAKFTLDPSQETRYHGRKIFQTLLHHDDFDRLLNKNVPAKDLTSLRDILENIRTKGMGDKPSDTPSARAKRSVSNSRVNSGSNSREKVGSASTDIQTTQPSSTKKGKRSAKVDEQSAESIKMLHKDLSSSEWTVRLKGIQTLQDMCVENPDLIASNIVKVFDAFILRLQDSNSKVNLQALQTMEDIVPRLAEYLPAVVQRVAPSLATNLASKNSSIAQTSSGILDLLMEHVDPTVLVQPFCNATQYGNTRVKPPMINKLSDLSSMVWPRKQQPVIRFILPVLGHLLNNMSGSGAVHGGTGNIREATNTLAKTLHSLMGESLFQHSPSLTPRQQKALRELINDN